MRLRKSLVALALVAAPAGAQELCPGVPSVAGADSRMFKHLRYAEADTSTLVAAPEGLSPEGRCLVHPAVLADLMRMIAEADRDPTIAGTIRTLSCQRSIAYQQEVFCRDMSAGPAVRAIKSAPPAFSEHATGYVIDFATAGYDPCNLAGCFAATPVGQWLMRNAPRFGFEMSFPAGAHQGVSWEPWHWRWVGADPRVPGAAPARAVFARARGLYPAHPRAAGTPLVLRLTGQPPNPAAAPVATSAP